MLLLLLLERESSIRVGLHFLHTGMSKDHWRDTIQKDTFIKELWPAQHLLGDMGIFSGNSGVVQMPTSAGKTKAIEIIIRASFIADRTSLVVIVSPFRALCHEIKNSLNVAFINEDVHVNEMTDIPFFAFDLEILLTGKQVLIVTPEKLLYMLSHNPELSDDIGLIIYDEGHQFDNGSRGITFELLLTSLKNMIQVDTSCINFSCNKQC
jgi:POLQ-like helicase